MALTQLGARRIADLSDGTEEATLCSVLFDDIADEVISLGSWTSCVFRATLGALSSEPLFGYEYQHQLPEDPYCLVVLNAENSTGDPITDFQIEGRLLLSNSPTARIKYIGRPSDTEAYDPMLRRAVTYRLKMDLAHTLTGNLSLVSLAQQQFQQAVIDGLKTNNKQGTPEQRLYNALIDVR